MIFRQLVKLTLVVSSPAAAQPGEVPFVGCPSDGQTGPLAAPASDAIPRVDGRVASQLAYYRSHDLGVLAPRGWHCFGVYGSNGSSLLVSPEPIDSAALFGNFGGFQGRAVQVSRSYGGTSGRFSVAEGISRYFPDHIAFAQAVEAGGLSDPLPTGPYPDDWLRRRGTTEIEYRTPAGRQGAGTASYLRPNSEPIIGVVMLLTGEEPNLLQLSVRLGRGQEALASEIVASLRETRAEPETVQ